MNEPTAQRVERVARLRWVPIAKMKVSPLAQRELRPARVDHLATNFDLEQIGTPTVNSRDGHFYILDGQHRVEALRVIGWGDQQIQCWTYEGLTEQEEAEKFLKLNDVLPVKVFEKFRIAVRAERSVESDIDRIVRAQDLRISTDKAPGSIRAVAALRRIYTQNDPATLGRTLRIVRDAYGDAGMEGVVISGIGLVCGRYNGNLSDQTAVDKLGSARGGVNGLLNRAEEMRLKTGSPKAHCVAAAAVEFINRGRGGEKLSSWWKEES